MRRRGWLGPALALLLVSCGSRVAVPPPLAAMPTPTLAPVNLPADDAPHDVLTEWWYYTGHLQARANSTTRYGFELVFFQSRRDNAPAVYAAHFAVTDVARRQFHYDQKFAVAGSSAGATTSTPTSTTTSVTGIPASSLPGIQVGPGYALALGAWSLGGADGHDHLHAMMADYAIDLDLRSLKPAVLHNGNGIISFGAAGDSYYYSRTRNQVAGTVQDHGEVVPVEGVAWMDHQWGNFIGTAEGGWDWYSLQLDDQTEVMIFNLRAPDGSPAGSYASFIDAQSHQSIVAPGQYHTEALGTWQSPHSGAVYPSGWRVRLDPQALDLTVTPTVKDQELDTAGSTGLIYWEGASAIRGTAAGRPITGQAYVELVGYRKR